MICMYHISGRRHGQFGDARACVLCGGFFPDPGLRPAVPHGGPVGGSAAREPRAEGEVKPVGQKAISAGALAYSIVTLQLTGSQRAPYLPVFTLLSHHVASLLSTPASPAHSGVPQRFHHRPRGRVKPSGSHKSSVTDF